MADVKITALPATTTLAATDVFVVVTNIAVTPTDSKVTFTNLVAAVLESPSPAGKGLVCTTPDGLHTYRIAVDNAGSVTTEQLT